MRLEFLVLLYDYQQSTFMRVFSSVAKKQHRVEFSSEMPDKIAVS